jgi:hypothetical protein
MLPSSDKHCTLALLRFADDSPSGRPILQSECYVDVTKVIGGTRSLRLFYRVMSGIKALNGKISMTEIPVHRVVATRLVQLCWCVFLAGLLFDLGCSRVRNQSVATLRSRPTLSHVNPENVTPGNTGTLILRGANFVPGASISAPPGIEIRNVRVNSPAEITADYAITANSPPGYLNLTVTTPGGTSEPGRMRIVPTVYQFPLRNDFARNRAIGRTGPPAYESLEIGIHSDQVQNPDGSQTNAYLEVSLTDAKGQSVAVPGEGELSDMDNVDNPEDSDEPGPVVTPYSLTLQRPDPGEYFLHIKSVRTGSFTLEVEVRRLSATVSSQDTLAEMDVPVYPGGSFELKLVCHRDPFSVDIGSGGLQPPHGAFSFALPTDSAVRPPSDAKLLGVAIYYDAALDPSSFRATLDGSEITSMFHVRPGKLELVLLPLDHGQHNLSVQANTKSGLSSLQEFHIQH